jgi:hypothetical protein
LVLSLVACGSVAAWVGLDHEAAGDEGKTPKEERVAAAEEKKPADKPSTPEESEKPKPVPPAPQPVAPAIPPAKPPIQPGAVATAYTAAELCKQLDDADLAKCRKAVDDLDRLNRMEARRAIPALVRALRRHPDESFRRRAAEVLQRIGPPLAADLECLGPAIQITFKPVKLYVVNVVAQLQPAEAKPVIHVLVEALKDRDDEVRGKAVLALQKMGPAARPVAFLPLLKVSNDADEDFARAGFNALKLLGKLTPDEFDALLDTLKDAKGRADVRWYAVDRLGELGRPAAKAVPALTYVLRTEKDESALLKSIAAVRAIGDKQPDLTAALLALAKLNPGDRVRLDALDAIDALDLAGLSISQIVNLRLTEQSANVKSALDVRLQNRLAQLKVSEMAELVPLLRHTDVAFVKMALDVVQKRKGEAAAVAEDLAGLLTHEDAAVRNATYLAIQALGPSAKPAMPKLLSVMKELPKEQQPIVALIVVLVDPKDETAAESTMPVLIEALNPRYEGRTISTIQVQKAMLLMGQPAVDGIRTAFRTLEYRGKENINHRKALFECLVLLGPACKSKENYEWAEGLRKREGPIGYKDVYDAALRASRAMDP